ncbi:MAG: glutaminase A, partial [Firmicutes bacterium]|nr:glutaminase A [Bacillota bacterium]
MQRMLETIVADNRALTRQGQVARYIPELARIDPTIV